MELTGQTAIITGASSGIGKAIAQAFDAAEMNLVLTARSQEKLADLASTLQHAVILPGEITDPALPKQLLEKAIAEFGQLDAVINNAGIMHMMAIEDADVEALCTMIRVNFEAVVRISYAVLPYLKQQGHGFIINISRYPAFLD